jgi:phage portal protein BeeE
VRGSNGLDGNAVTSRPLELRPDLDTIEALSTEREALWSRLEKSTFLTPNEKRTALGYAPIPGGDEIETRADSSLSPPAGRGPG